MFDKIRERLVKRLGVEAAERTETNQRKMLITLNRAQMGGKHVYAGTVPAHVKARRRAKNRMARASRRVNR